MSWAMGDVAAAFAVVTLGAFFGVVLRALLGKRREK